MWIAAYVVVTFLSFPHPVGEGVLDLGLLLGWLSPACLLLALKGLGPRRAAGVAFGAAWLAHAAILHWIWVVTVRYGGAPSFVGVLAPLVPGGYMALCVALMGYAWGWLNERGVGGPVVAAVLWVATDHLRTFLFGGLPWATLGYTQHANSVLLPLVTLTGVYGLAFVIALGGAGLAGSIDRGIRGLRLRRSDLAAMAAVPLIHIATLGLSTGVDERVGARDAATLRIAAVQGNVDQIMKWDGAVLGQTVTRYIELSEQAVEQGAQLVVWPETAVPGALEYDPATLSRLRRFVQDTGAALVLGSVGIELDEDREQIERFFDSAFLIDSSGRMAPRYDKTHLVPFGEYVPLRALLGRLVGVFASGIAQDDVSPGPAPRSLELALEAGEPPILVGIPICYELLFPDLVRRFAADGAQVLLAITNDAWYGRTGAPHQFLAITAMRSAETRTWTVRAANTGVSAIIDASGRVLDATAIFESGFVIADVPLRAPDEQTFYVRHGDLFTYLCWLVLAAFGVRAATLRRHPRKESEIGTHE
jgi:apolipoprotein N-acyltransferase